MGNLRAAVTIASIAFAAACGDDGATIDAPIVIIDASIDAPPDAYVPDAPNYDFSCYQNQAPTTATETVAISGLAQQIMISGSSFSFVPSPGVFTRACKGDCMDANDLGQTGPTTSTGMYTSATVTTNGEPLDGYLT